VDGGAYGFKPWPLPDELPLPDCDGLVVVSVVEEEDDEVDCSVAVCSLDVCPPPVPLEDVSGFVSADGWVVCVDVFLL
jgi:hypothetical protein